MAQRRLTTRPKTALGFTLIEVIIALFVIALGIGALLSTLVSAAENTAHLRDKSFAEWVALNRIAEVRLSVSKPGVGVVNGVAEFAGANWRWRQTVSDPGMAGIKRIDVMVGRGTPNGAEIAPPANGDSETADFPALATAYGLLGDAVAPATGVDIGWSLQPPNAPGSSSSPSPSPSTSPSSAPTS